MQSGIDINSWAVLARRPAPGQLALAVALMFFAPAVLLAAGGPRAGDAAPDFVLRSLEDGNLRLSEFRGEVVLIGFWASWCGPCQQQIERLERMSRSYGASGLVALGVYIEGDSGRAATMADRLRVSFPVLIDDKQVVSRLYDLDSLPITYLVDRDGVVRAVLEGYDPAKEPEHERTVRSLLGEWASE